MKDIVCKKCGLLNSVHVEVKSGHHVAYCDGCGAYVKHLAFDKQRFYFGKHKGQDVETFNDIGYLKWFLENIKKISPAMRTALEKRISQLSGDWQDAVDDKEDYK